MLEFCWFACHGQMIYLGSACLAAAGITTGVPLSFSRWIFYGYWGFANGPFALAVLLLNNALVLHDLPNLSSVFIHLSPGSLVWSLRWYAPRVNKAFPGIFDLPDPANSTETFMDLFIPSMSIYGIWWVIYLVYCIFVGRYHGLPDSKYDTQARYTFRTNKMMAKICGFDNRTLQSR